MLKSPLNGILGLFVDDRSFAVTIFAIVALAGWISFRFAHSSAVVGTLLFIGCLTALVENVLRTGKH